MVFWVVAILISIPAGLGLAKMLMTIILEKSNVVGNSLSDTEMISTPVTLYDQQDRVQNHANYLSHYIRALKAIPEYEEAKSNSLVKDIDSCAADLCLRDGEVCLSNPFSEPVVEMKIAPVARQLVDDSVPEEAQSNTPKRSWKDAIEDPVDDLSEFDPNDRNWHK